MIFVILDHYLPYCSCEVVCAFEKKAIFLFKCSRLNWTSNNIISSNFLTMYGTFAVENTCKVSSPSYSETRQNTVNQMFDVCC